MKLWDFLGWIFFIFILNELIVKCVIQFGMSLIIQEDQWKW